MDFISSSAPMIRHFTFLPYFFREQPQLHPLVIPSTERGHAHSSPSCFSRGRKFFFLGVKVLEVPFISFSPQPFSESSSWEAKRLNWLIHMSIQREGNEFMWLNSCLISLFWSSLLSSYTTSPVLCNNQPVPEGKKYLYLLSSACY